MYSRTIYEDGRHGVDLTTLVARTKLDNNFRALSGLRATSGAAFKTRVCNVHLFPSRRRSLREYGTRRLSRRYDRHVLLPCDTPRLFSDLQCSFLKERRIVREYSVFSPPTSTDRSGVSMYEVNLINFFTQRRFCDDERSFLYPPVFIRFRGNWMLLAWIH